MRILRKMILSVFSKPAGDIQQLLAEAHAFPRFKSHDFTFRNMKFHVTDFLSVAHQLKEYFEEEEMKFIAATERPVIYDCGANVGVSVLYFKKLYNNARIIAFEPDPQINRCLKLNLKNNGINDVTLVEKAVWTTDEGISFGSEGADGGSVYSPLNKIKVPSVRLKELLAKESVIDCLKMDIEGAEFEVLNDCKTEISKVKYLFVEYHSWKDQKQQLGNLLAILQENGFRYYIKSLGKPVHQPFLAKDNNDMMDVQLDIHAVNSNLIK